MGQAEQTGVLVKSKFFFLMFLLVFFPPTVVIDGNAEKVKWGERFFPVAPGEHTVKIFFSYFFMKECGPAMTTVTVREGHTTHITYKPPWLMFLKGRITTAEG